MNAPIARITPELTKAYAVNRAAIASADRENMARQLDVNLHARRLARDFAIKHFGADPAKPLAPAPAGSSLTFAQCIAGNCLTDEERAGLAIYLIDSIDRIGSDLRVEAESVLADVLSGTRT